MRYRVIRTTIYPHAPESTLPDERRILAEADAEVVPVRCNSPEELAALVHDADALFAGHLPTNAAVIAAMPRCKGIVTASVGFDLIDLVAASARRIPVANVPDFCAREVATHAIGLMIACARKIVLLDNALRRGIWDPPMFPPMAAIHGETLGLLSFGRIARHVAVRAQAVEMRVIAADPFVDVATAAELGVALLPLDDLLRQSDYLSVHAPLNDATRHLLNDRAFGLI